MYDLTLVQEMPVLRTFWTFPLEPTVAKNLGNAKPSCSAGPQSRAQLQHVQSLCHVLKACILIGRTELDCQGRLEFGRFDPTATQRGYILLRGSSVKGSKRGAIKEAPYQQTPDLTCDLWNS